MAQTHRDNQVVYVHKETGFEIPLSQLKEMLGNSCGEYNVGFKIRRPMEAFSIRGFVTLEKDDSMYESYEYPIKDIPFSKDFFMLTTGGEFTVKRMCPRCGAEAYISIVGSKGCARCGEIMRVSSHSHSIENCRRRSVEC